MRVFPRPWQEVVSDPRYVPFMRKKILEDRNFEEEENEGETTTEAVQESKGGRKAWQSSRKRIPKRLRDFGNKDVDGRETTGQKEEGTSDDKDREVNSFDNAVAQEGFVVS